MTVPFLLNNPRYPSELLKPFSWSQKIKSVLLAQIPKSKNEGHKVIQ